MRVKIIRHDATLKRSLGFEVSLKTGLSMILQINELPHPASRGWGMRHGICSNNV